jgi:dCMP deaminase
MSIAQVVSTRSTCHRKYVGAVLVRNRIILSTGYNGSIRGMPHCSEVGHMMEGGHCVATIHAEANAIIQAALHGISSNGAACYVTHLPCLTCTKMLINAGISQIIYLTTYRADENAMAFFKEAGVAVRQVGP